MTNFWDTLEEQASGWLTNYGGAVLDSGLKAAGIVKVAEPPKSNLTANQVAQGQQGSISYLPSMSNGGGMPAWLIPVIAGVGLILVFFMVRKK